MSHDTSCLSPPGALALNIVSDWLVAFACSSTPFNLFYCICRRKDLQFRWVLCFAIFIGASGLTHVPEIPTVGYPAGWITGSAAAITAIATVATAMLLIHLVPKALRLASPSVLE